MVRIHSHGSKLIKLFRVDRGVSLLLPIVLVVDVEVDQSVFTDELLVVDSFGSTISGRILDPHGPGFEEVGIDDGLEKEKRKKSKSALE